MLFNKEIDKLSTNRQGTYVLVDSNFNFHTAAWQPKRSKNLYSRNQNLGEKQSVKPSEYSLLYISFLSGMVRGALCCLGHICLVTSEIDENRTVKFVVAVTNNSNNSNERLQQ